MQENHMVGIDYAAAEERQLCLYILQKQPSTEQLQYP